MTGFTPPSGQVDGSGTLAGQQSQFSSGHYNSSLAQPAHGYPPPSDEIDLVELLGFFWKIKFEIVAGLIIGLIGGAAVAYRVLPVVYKTQIPLSLDKSEPQLADAKKFVETFNATLNSTETARLIWRSVFNQSPELGRVFKDAGLTDESLATSQALSAAPDKAPLRLRESASPRDFVLDVSLPVTGLTTRSGDVFAAAIQHAFSGVASAADSEKLDGSAKPVSAAPGAAGSAGASGAAGGAPIEVQDEFREQLLKAKQDYLKIEVLLNKLSRTLPEFTSFMAVADADLRALNVNLTAGGAAMAEAQEQFTVQAQYERMHRMVALLLAEGRMKPDEANDTVQRAQQIREEIFELIPLARREAEKLAAAGGLRKQHGKDGVRAGIPLMPTLISASLNGSAMTIEQPVSKRKISLVLGAFLGAFAGFAFGGLRIFLKKNGHRLREVVAQ